VTSIGAPETDNAAVGESPLNYLRLYACLIVTLTSVAGLWHGLVWANRPLWEDEACTWWTIEAGPLAILQGERNDGTPPLYFLIVWSVAQVAGTGEWSLRLPSMIAATALVPAIYLVARRMTTERTALLAATLATISPLVHYYAIEARNYSLVQLLALMVMYAFYGAFREPQVQRFWWLLFLCLAALLLTHNIAIFLLPVPLFLAAWLGGDRRKLIVGRTALVILAAFLVYVPWFLQALDNSQRGVGDWIKHFWITTPPALAIIRSIEVLGFAGAYPSYLGYLAHLGDKTSVFVRALGLVFGCGLLLLALAPLGKAMPKLRLEKRVLAGFLFGPLAATFVYSLLLSPIYLVGRYDTIRPHLGAVVIAAALFLALRFQTLLLENAAPKQTQATATAAYLGREARPDDPIVATGLRYAVTEYYLRQGGSRAALTSFPAEIAEHPGWYSGERLMQDPAQLERQGRDLAVQLERAAKRGARVWLLVTPDNPIDEFLYQPVLKVLVTDPALTQTNLKLACLQWRESKSLP
jgi:hypothetical protein